MKKLLSLVLVVITVGFVLYLARTPLLNIAFSDSGSDEARTLKVAELNGSVRLSRNELGMPLIEGESHSDIAFAMGYADAQDRLSQMVSTKLTAQGRLSEMAGDVALPIDRLMRSVGLHTQAINLYTASSDRVKKLLQSYADGVNYWLDNSDGLPTTLALSDYQPKKWTPLDSVSVFALLNFGLSQNLQQEVANLTLLKSIPAEQLPYLNPIYPDVELPFSEVEKLNNVTFGDQAKPLSEALASLPRSVRPGIAASNNWGISPQLTRGGASIIANDTHLPISLPSIWGMVHIITPGMNGAGISVPGLPSVVAGYNGHISWGMTMVMADTQDLYLEKLSNINGKLHYLYEGQWLPTRERLETLRVRNGKDQQLVVHETHHGPLLNVGENSALSHSIHPLMPQTSGQPYGIAYQSHDFAGDQSLNAFFGLMQSRSFEEAQATIKKIRAMPLNIVYGDRDNIGWQVTGLYPIRRAGLGLLPSPGWVDDYEWTGLVPADQHPHAQNPERGFIGTANERNVPADFPVNLTNSWYYPERGERIDDMIQATDEHDMATSKAMQLDDFSRLVGKVQAMLNEDSFNAELQLSISHLAQEQRRSAQRFLAHYRAIDGDLHKDSANGLIHHAFLRAAMHAIFADELGGADSANWRALQTLHDNSYSALIDHLLVDGRSNSPFWDDVQSPERSESKADIIANSLTSAQQWLVKNFGDDSDDWVWGDAHQYHFESATTQMADHLGGFQAAAVDSLSGFLDRGPYPASGDFSTLNVTGHTLGNDTFKPWLIPEMRLITDFSRDVPLVGINSTGQSDNPASEHYDDGIEAFVEGRYVEFPLDSEKARELYQLQTQFVPVN